MADPEKQAPEEDHFYEVLAGRAQGHAGAEAMRDALESEARTINEAESARTDELSAQEKSKMDAIKQQLIDQGVLASPISPAPGRHQVQVRTNRSSNSDQRMLADKLFHWLFGENWRHPMAIAASLLIATVVVVQMLPQGAQDIESNVIRGGVGASISVEDPALEAKNLNDELTKIGAEVVLVQINDDEWALQVNVEDRAHIDAVKQYLHGKAFAINKGPPYELSIRQIHTDSLAGSKSTLTQ